MSRFSIRNILPSPPPSVLRDVLALALPLPLSGCLGPTPYQVRQFNGGWQESAVGSNRWSVEFYGNGHTSRETVLAYWVHRCAELTRSKGFDYYVVLGRTPTTTTSDVEIEFRHASANEGDDQGAVRVKGGGTTYTPIYVPSAPVTTWSARGVIEMHRSPPPDSSRRVYIAKEILDRLGPAVREATSSGSNVRMPAGFFAGITTDSASASAEGATSSRPASGIGIRLEELEALLPKE